MSLATIAPDHWDRVRQRLLAEFGDEVFASWFSGVDLEVAAEDMVQLFVPTRFLQNRLQTLYKDSLLGICQKELGPAIRNIEFVVRSITRQPKVTDSKFLPLASPSCPKSREVDDKLAGSPLDSKHTFDTFISGSSNAMALSAAKLAVATPGATSSSFNPLYIHAPVGLGKTHLLQAIATAAKTNGRRAVYLTAEHFMFKFAAALRAQSAISFKEWLRSIDILLVDDLQFLQGQHIQTEFCHTINCLIDGARQVVIAADRVPTDLAVFDERMRSRLAGGLLVKIDTPDLTLRRQILDAKLGSFGISHDIIDFIANNITANCRDLEGAIARIVAHMQFAGIAPSIDAAESILGDMLHFKEPKRIKVEDIQKAVCKYYNLTKSELLSPSRARGITLPRQIAMYLSKTLTSKSLPEIGRLFGNRDHTTVIYSLRRIEKLVIDNADTVDAISKVKRILESS